MWIFSKKQSTWVNLGMAMRIGKNGNGEYIVICFDGSKVTIDKEGYESAMRWVDPDWYERHPDGRKDSIDINKAIKAIMKATGAKLEKEEKKEED